ncbi:bifunctional helix-turn-helix domain-containing protein/methylated-DNA--[protein]-cysteine S-methyltransferase [Aureimonas leprariae]|uniref:methylated-DNA--[protein]-cysteine S-methyltransferase n=1 Tax=Plantimonas leprariae TaxID=2615207 RepID=A0A7V7PL86_9HYPH|nr:bifunctional helix-turn-helix domain-containing protein/methylated-DNA--[protein]-cysteine S-methyltransferase [Aureimonas leprariae]KAB0676808.1 methylated-DNA--[protein]-cysteine S-methyltransferase [Aureimonas leprariae]
MPAPTPVRSRADADDYASVRAAIEFISTDYRDQPSLEEVAAAVGREPAELEALFRRWAGLTPKAFLQAVTINHARRLLAEGAPLLDASFEVGLSGPSRLHDLFVKHEAMSPGHFKAKGEGLELTYGYAPSPFGRAILVATAKGLAGIGFSDGTADGDEAALADMVRRWPRARFARDDGAVAPLAARSFEPAEWSDSRPLRVVLIGSDFEVRVWQALLEIPVGKATTYSGIASQLGVPQAARAVGAAVGRNPISFVVPCHRVLGKGGALTGYHWGLSRKRAMLGWEAGVLARA